MTVTVISWNPDNGDPPVLHIGKTSAAAKLEAARYVISAGDRVYEAELIELARAALRRRDAKRAFQVFERWISPFEATIRRQRVAE
jgi:hypothetical protein